MPDQNGADSAPAEASNARLGMIHAPHFLPWAGFLSRLVSADVFVLRDDVVYRKLYYVNRSQVDGSLPGSEWLTLPVDKASTLAGSVAAVHIAPGYNIKRLERRVEALYRRTTHYDDVWPGCRAAIARGWPSLMQINLELLVLFAQRLSARTRFVLASDLGAGDDDRTNTLVMLCKAADVNRLVFGEGKSVAVHDASIIRAASIEIEVQDTSWFVGRHEYVVDGRPRGGLELACNLGWETLAGHLRTGWHSINFLDR